MTRPLVLLALLVAFAGCDEGNPPPMLIGAALDSAIESTFSLIDASALQQDVAELASDEYGGRNAGYPSEVMAARYLATQMEQAGLAPMGDELGSESRYFQRFDFHPRWPTEPWEVLSSQNVLGFLEGSDPDLKHEIVVLGAHYDGQGQAGEADPDRWPSKDPLSVPDTIWNSADDNASGAAVVLAVARALSLNRPILRR